MTFELESRVSIGNFKFTGIHDIVIKTSMHSLVQTATLRLPAVAQVLKNGEVRSSSTALLFKQEDEVTIELGYNGELKTEFRGFVKRKNFTEPFELECEGFSRQLLRSKVFNVHYKKIGLRDLLLDLISGTGIVLHKDVVNAELEQVIIRSKNALEAIEELKQKGLVLYCYFINHNELYCGLKNLAQTNKTVSYWLGWNTVKDGELKFRDKKDVKAYASITYKDEKGKTKHKHYGEKGGIEIKEELQQTMSDEAAISWVEAAVDRVVYEGYEGKIGTLLQPYCESGWKAIIKDERFPERSGNFMIESVETRFGINGAKRSVEIGKRLNAQK